MGLLPKGTWIGSIAWFRSSAFSYTWMGGQSLRYIV
jgi:hypothetical protein